MGGDLFLLILNPAGFVDMNEKRKTPVFHPGALIVAYIEQRAPLEIDLSNSAC